MRTTILTVLTIASCWTCAGAEKSDSNAVQVIPNVVYFEGNEADKDKHKLDLYLPVGKKDFPVVFFIHGGAWTIGDRKQYIGLGRVLARQGVGVVIPSYRLTPVVQHPGHIEDVARAFAWTHKNIVRRRRPSRPDLRDRAIGRRAPRGAPGDE